MNNLIRGLFQYGSEGPEASECMNNWIQLQRSNVEFTDQFDQQIIDQISQWNWLTTKYSGGGDREQVIDAPSFDTLHSWLESLNQIEASSRLDEIKGLHPKIRTNYQSFIVARQDEQKLSAFTKLNNTCNHIAAHGLVITTTSPTGKKITRHWKGIADSDEYRQLMSGNLHESDDFQMNNLSSLLASPDQPCKYVIPQFRFAEGRPNMIIAWAGLSKTFLMLDLALSVGAGLPTCWGDVGVMLKGKVAILDYEMGIKITKRRLRRLAFGRGITNFDNIDVVSFSPVSLTSKAAESKFMRLCDGRALCVIDSFRAATPSSKDENSSEMAEYLVMLSKVSDKTGCIFVILHHERKTQELTAAEELSHDFTQDARGSSALMAALGATISIRRVKGSDDFKISQGKVSMGRRGDSVLFRLEDTGNTVPDFEDHEGLVIKTINPGDETDNAAKKERDLIYQTIENYGPKSLSVLREMLRKQNWKGRNGAEKKVLDQLIEDGVVIRSPTGGYVTSATATFYGVI